MKKAARGGIETIALTDHNTFEGSRSLLEKKIALPSIDLIHAAELDASPRIELFHILAYFREMPDVTGEELKAPIPPLPKEADKRKKGYEIQEADTKNARTIIRRVRRAGGIPVLAHPFTLDMEKEYLAELILDLMESGLLGLEIYNSRDEIREVSVEIDPQFLENFAEQHQLFKVSGSDYHGKGETEIGAIPFRYQYPDLPRQLNRQCAQTH